MKYRKRIEQYRSGKTQREKHRGHKKSYVVDSDGGSAGEIDQEQTATSLMISILDPHKAGLHRR